MFCCRCPMGGMGVSLGGALGINCDDGRNSSVYMQLITFAGNVQFSGRQKRGSQRSVSDNPTPLSSKCRFLLWALNCGSPLVLGSPLLMSSSHGRVWPSWSERGKAQMFHSAILGISRRDPELEEKWTLGRYLRFRPPEKENCPL
eukprot:GEMP01116399.1.p1 GENE.GEMP01116399.1~~GEMP01116399.1.p1  ORF type:complete len:145 (+),score=13.37 GEMP01116399.1:186-620(+)